MIKDLIIGSLVTHKCTLDSCGTDHKPEHDGCFELDSDLFVYACSITEKRHNNEPLAPD